MSLIVWGSAFLSMAAFLLVPFIPLGGKRGKR